MSGVVKSALNFKREQNGLFLKVHHTVMVESGDKRKIPFLQVEIARNNEIFAAVDEDDNVFIFHLTLKCFWEMPAVKVHKCTAMKFVPRRSNNLLIANKSGFIYEIEINTGTTLRCIKAFSSPINQLALPSNDPKTFVASSSNQIKIYDHESFVKKYEFTSGDDAKIVSVKIIPHDDRLFVVLHNNIVCILTNALKLIRHFDPLKARQKYMQKSNQKMEKLNYISNPAAAADDDEADVDKLIKSVTRDYLNGIVMDVSFTRNGNSFCLSFLDNSVMFCSTSMWDVKRVIKFPDFYIKQCRFIPFSLDYNPNELLTLTSNDDLMLMSLKDLNSKMLIDMNNSFSFTLSSNGKVLLNIQHSGEILVYNLDHCLSAVNDVDLKKLQQTMTESDVKCSKQMSNNWNVGLDKIQMKLNSMMPIERLLPILKEFGEYPDKYRSMIWKTLLKLPQNFNSFSRLLKRELHSCVTNYAKRYSLVDQKDLNNLRKIVSCLAHWTTIFGYLNFLPKFVFPFLKICKGDLLLCFEVVATILCNHCQLWFEFAPLQMPYNYLCLIENILMENDRKLFNFYKSKNVTTKIYALPLMETAFSEVLDEQQWLQLWDHIVSNDSFFMIFVIVAYNVTLRLTVMRCETTENVEKIFLDQNYVNLKKLITKAYRLMENCPASIHPSRYMKPFEPLTRGDYQKFENYPKNLSDMKVNEIDLLREEQKILNAKLAEMESLEKTISLRMEGFLMDEEYEKRMREVESCYEKAIEEEEERITYQRKMVLLNMKKIREGENEMLIRAKNSLQSKRVAASENELEMMLRSIEKQRTREDIELQMADENLKLKAMSSQLQNFDNESKMKQESLKNRFKESIVELAHQKERFFDQVKQLESASTATSSTSKGSEVEYIKNEELPSEEEVFEIKFQKIQNEYVRFVGSRKSKKDYVDCMKNLENESEQLEQEIYELLRRLN